MADLLLTRKTTISSFYQAWSNMKTRCNNKKSRYFYRYGGRGITVCKKWSTFDGFIDDMYDSYKPGLTLDRIDNDKGYSKSNCRWVTMKEQQNHRTNNRLIEIDGVTKTLAQWSELSDVKPSTIRQRYYSYGWEIKRALGMVG